MLRKLKYERDDVIFRNFLFYSEIYAKKVLVALVQSRTRRTVALRRHRRDQQIDTSPMFAHVCLCGICRACAR